MSTQFKLNVGQYAFLKSKAKQASICSGLGGGKSFILVLSQLVNEVFRYPDAKHCFAALSYAQLRDTSIPLFEMFLTEIGVPFTFKASDKKFIINGKTELLMRSEDVADRMRSVEIGSLHCEELAYWQEKNFKTFLGRLRDKRGSMRMRAATTPNGLNWFYRYFVEDKKEGRELCRTSTKDNKHLPDEYIEMLIDSYDDELLEQELEGGFINIGATKTYYKFDRKKHVKDLYKENKNKITAIGMDFNVNPMTAACGFIENDCVYITDEIYLKNSNTHKIKDTILQRYGDAPLIIPDATGKARKTAAVRSDHDILREVFEVARVRNPARKDRFNCVNNLLGKGRLFIDKRCVKLINDLEKFCDDGSDESLGHISDALGYLCWYYFPIDRFASSNRGRTVKYL